MHAVYSALQGLQMHHSPALGEKVNVGAARESNYLALVQQAAPAARNLDIWIDCQEACFKKKKRPSRQVQHLYLT